MKALTKEEFIEKAKRVHGEKYNYENVVYTNNSTKVEIGCPIHGVFFQTPHHHLLGHGCRKCGMNGVVERNEYLKNESARDFVQKARKIHGEHYSYEKVRYISAKSKVKIICPIHGTFEQTADHHLHGSGCPFCNQSHLERIVESVLSENGFEYEKQKRFPWLKNIKPLSLDFFLPKYNLAIECQGIQHFIPSRFGGCKDEESKMAFEKARNNDVLKMRLCKQHGMKLLYFSDVKEEENFLGKNLIKNKKSLILCIQHEEVV